MKQKLVYSHDQYYKDETGSLDYYKKALYLFYGLYFYPRKRGFRYTYCILYQDFIYVVFPCFNFVNM